MLKTFKMKHGDHFNFITIDINNIAEIHLYNYNTKSFKLITKHGDIYEVVETGNNHGTHEEMYECFLQAIENNERYITDFFLNFESANSTPFSLKHRY